MLISLQIIGPTLARKLEEPINDFFYWKLSNRRSFQVIGFYIKPANIVKFVIKSIYVTLLISGTVTYICRVC